ncbi:MAG: hypothetical protein ACKORF_01955 [Micrococcales bacterium]
MTNRLESEVTVNEDFEQQVVNEANRISELELGLQPEEFNRLRELLESELNSQKLQ